MASQGRRDAAALVTALTFAAFFATAAVASDPGAVRRGRTFVTANCSPCHAVDRKGDSPLAQAPRFRDLSKRYPLEDLEEALSEGIVTGHKDMPQFKLDHGQVEDVISYLKSLAPRRRSHHR